MSLGDAAEDTEASWFHVLTGPVAHLVGEAVEQQVQAAERRLDLLLRLLRRQPAEGSAAGAPGEVATLQDQEQRVSRLSAKAGRRSC